MAIVDDLTAAACWSPAFVPLLPPAAVAIAFGLHHTPIFRVGFVFGRLALLLFWLLVALGQWWLMRRYSSSHRRWTATVVLAGFLASFVLFFASGLTLVPWTGILFSFLVAASTATGTFDPTPGVAGRRRRRIRVCPGRCSFEPRRLVDPSPPVVDF